MSTSVHPAALPPRYPVAMWKLCIMAFALVSSALAQSPGTPVPPQGPPRFPTGNAPLVNYSPPVPTPAKFADGWRATDPKTSISIRIVQAHTSPRCQAESNCPWLLKWTSPFTGHPSEVRAEILVDAGDHGQSSSAVPADPKERDKFSRHLYTFRADEVKFIRIVVTKGTGKHEREIARAVFR